MELNIQAIKFDITDKLSQFVAKKADKLVHRHPAVSTINVTLKVVKPETALNKHALLEVKLPHEDVVVADKTADTFEEAIDVCLEAVERQLEKKKDRK